MKKQLLFFLLLAVGIVNAQIVDIPDSDFKNYLLNYSDYPYGFVIDTNDDDEIQETEALAVTDLNLVQNDLAPFVSIEGIQSFTNLETLQVGGAIPSIDLSGLSALTFLYITDPALESLNLTGLTALNQIDLAMTAIASLDISSLLNLQLLQITQADDLTSFIVGNNNALESIWLSSASLQELDLSGCPNINSLNISLDGALHDCFLNLKNGNFDYSDASAPAVYFYNNDGHIFYVCIDEGEEVYFTNATEDIVFGSYCSFTPGGDYNTITGNFIFDGDNNGCDTEDSFSTMVKVSIEDGMESGSTFSNVNGVYNFYTETGTLNLTPSFENSDWFTITPSSATVIFEDDNNNIETQNFCVTANGEHPDVEVVIAPIVPAQPGFNAVYKITYRNKGNQNLSGGVLLAYVDTVLDYVSSTSGVSVAENIFGWSYTDLQPFETRVINLTLNVNSPAETPAVNIDDVLTFTATIYPDTDETPEDNTFTLNQTVVGSFDPNDITCLEGETVHMSKIGEYLHYNINFENTGTAPATFVVVKDVINEEQFDISTLQLMYASHDVQTKIEGNQVEFYFGDINLAANGGKGNVLFKIKTLETLQAEDVVTQQADIFFDYNLPIVTNEATTTFATLNNTVFTKDNTVKLYPNPTADNVTISAKGMVKSVALYDIQGRLLQVTTPNNTQTTLNLSAQPSGLYFVKIITEEGSVVEKLVKQ